MKQHVAPAAACGAGFLWGTGALVMNLLIVRHGFSPETISFRRFVVGAVVLLAVFGRTPLWRALATRWPLVLGAGTPMAGYVLCWFLGIDANDNGDGCISSCEGASGIETADFSTVTSNIASGNAGEGIEVEGIKSTVTGNTTKDNGDIGLRVECPGTVTN